jgi:hypothetical protein
VEREAVRRGRRFGPEAVGPSRKVSGRNAKATGSEEGTRRGFIGEERDQRPRDVEGEIAGEPAREFWLALGLVLVDNAQK